MIWFNKLRGFIALNLIGKDNILKLYKWLYDHKWQKTLAMMIGWAGKYWYLRGVKEAWTSQ